MSSTTSTPTTPRKLSWRALWARPASDRAFILLVALTFVLVAWLRVGRADEVEVASSFAVIFTSIVVEALPFVLLGALVSGVIEVYVPARWFDKLAALPTRLQIPGAVLGGLALPVCECGSVPVARRLALKGMHPGAAVAFMLAAPIINPVVIASTIVAYQGNSPLAMAGARVGLGIVLAVAVGAVISRWGGIDLRRMREADAAAHSHDHAGSRPRQLLAHATGDLLMLGRFVVIGAALAAALQTVVPQSAIAGIASTPVVGVLLMMLLGFLLSLCSEADAFVAVSFSQFSPGAQLGFLVFGPALDLKLALLYAGAFGAAFVGRLVLVAVPLVLAGSLLLGGFL